MLTDKDQDLIALLQINGRESVAALARKLGVSRTTVQDRLHRLEDSGAIAGYQVRLGRDVVAGIRAFVEITVEPARLVEVLAELKQLGSIETLHTVSGKFDLIAVIRADNPELIDNQLDKIGTIRGITRTASAIILSTKVDRR